MWHLDHEIGPWFERVEEEREAKYGGSGGDRDETVPMMTNDYADQLRKG